MQNHRKPVQVRAEQTRARILEKARKAFAQHGFSSANVRDIGAEAGVTHSVIRYYFGTKIQLWKEAVRDMFAIMEEEMQFHDDILSNLDEIDSFKEFIRRYIRYSAKHPEHAQIVVSESVTGGERLDWLAKEVIAPRHKLLGSRLDQAGSKIGLASMTPLSFTYILSSICQMPFILKNEAKALYGVDMGSEQVVDQHIESVLNLFFPQDQNHAK